MTDLATKPEGQGTSSVEPADLRDEATSESVEAVEAVDSPTSADEVEIEELPESTGTEIIAEADSSAEAVADTDEAGLAEAAAYAWAPAEPKRKKRRLGLWIGIPAAVAAIALVATSLLVIAPGTTIAGVSVGGMTAGAAADAVEHRLADTTVVLTGAGGGTEVTGGQLGASIAHASGEDVALTGAQLGASVDARGLADAAFATHPMWNPTAWFAKPATAVVSLDADAATAALRKAAPALYTDPTDAKLAFDAASASYVVTPAIAGEGVDVDAVRQSLQDAFDAGKTRVEFAVVKAPVDARVSTSVAQGTADTLNKALDAAGFYVGTERSVPVDRTVAASWITLSTDAHGQFQVGVDEAAVQAAVDALPAAVNRAAVDARVITDTDGKVLRTEAAGTAGRALGATAGLGASFAKQLAAGNAVFELPVTEAPPTTVTLTRRIEVNLSEQRVYLFENESVVQSWLISSGLPGHDTNQGHFRINAQLKSQNMGNRDLTQAPNYFQPDVPYVSYFNGDEALHGAYWHHNFGNRMSHGCVNMPVDAAEFVYYWAPIGTEVWVHSVAPDVSSGGILGCAAARQRLS